MKEFEKISIRGRMAYLLCMFEKLLLYYGCKKEEWSWIMEKFWNYTSIQYLDDWIYEMAEYLPENIEADEFEQFEIITYDEYVKLKELYKNLPADIVQMTRIIFELASCDAYASISDNSPFTIMKLEEAIKILKRNGIGLVDYKKFLRFKFSEKQGWGKRFDGRGFSVFLD